MLSCRMVNARFLLIFVNVSVASVPKQNEENNLSVSMFNDVYDGLMTRRYIDKELWIEILQTETAGESKLRNRKGCNVIDSKTGT